MMLSRKQIIIRGLGVGIISSIPVMILSLLGAQLAGYTFLPFDIFDWLTHIMPGPVLAVGIMGLIRGSQLMGLGPSDIMINGMEQVIAVLLFLSLGGIYGTVLGVLIFYTRPLARAWAWLGGGIMLLFWLQIEASLGFERTSLGAIVVGSTFLALGWGWVMGFWAQTEIRLGVRTHTSELLTRRRFFIYLGAGGLATLLSFFGILQYEQKHRGQFSVSGTTSLYPASNLPVRSQTEVPFLKTTLPAMPHSPPAPSDSLPGDSSTAGVLGPDGRILPAPGTRSEITSLDQFYQVAINIAPPKLDAYTWRLSIHGLADNPLLLSLADLIALPALDQISTLSCQFNPVGGDLIGNARWTGTRLRDLLFRASLKPAVKTVKFLSLDGYYESVSLDEALDDRALLIYAMNGLPLSPEHGFPLRLFLPNRYGMKQPKWLSSITATDQPGSGYWSDRQWDSDAIVATTSVIDPIAINQMDPKTQTVPIGGIAYAGSRGIRKVEVQMDTGPWVTVVLRKPALGQSSWVQWRYNTPYQPGSHIFRVRATDGTGTLQTDQESDNFPHGATGIFSYQVTM